MSVPQSDLDAFQKAFDRAHSSFVKHSTLSNIQTSASTTREGAYNLVLQRIKD